MRFPLILFFLLCAFSSFSQDSLKRYQYPEPSNESGMVGYVNSDNEYVIEPQYKSGTTFENESLAVVSLDIENVERFAVIDSVGKYIISFDEGYELISLENELDGWILVIKNGKWGYIDKNSKVLIPLQYDDLGDFYVGLAYAKRGNKYGFIDVNNNTKIDFKYKWALNYGSIQPDGFCYAPVEKGSKRGYINNKGELVIKCIYDSGYQFENGLVPAKRMGKWGVINTKGEIIIPFEYDLIQPYGDENIIVARKEDHLTIDYCFNWQGELVEKR
jgi:hypothetical protein